MSRRGGKRRWSELSGSQRAGIVAGSTLQLGLLAAALRDLRHRPPVAVRGSKKLWTAACFINVVGPLAYLAFGRRR